ncbi:hypothetical protein [Rhodococcus rhodnii]|nr:hypothetical protein [Rhodococcus rhodnii]
MTDRTSRAHRALDAAVWMSLDGAALPLEVEVAADLCERVPPELAAAEVMSAYRAAGTRPGAPARVRAAVRGVAVLPPRGVVLAHLLDAPSEREFRRRDAALRGCARFVGRAGTHEGRAAVTVTADLHVVTRIEIAPGWLRRRGPADLARALLTCADTVRRARPDLTAPQQAPAATLDELEAAVAWRRGLPRSPVLPISG